MKYYCNLCDFRTRKKAILVDHKLTHPEVPIYDIEFKTLNLKELKSLMTSWRFDLMAKYLYIKFKDKDIDSNFYSLLYSKHIEAFNGYNEWPGEKIGEKAFFDSFDNLIEDMTQNGFNKTHYIPIGYDNIITNGAHRTTCAYYYGIKPYVKIDKNSRQGKYDYKLFLDRNFHAPLDRLYADRMALEYLKINNNMRCMILQPISYKINSKNHKIYEQVRDIIRSYGVLYYEKEINLSGPGCTNLHKELYRGEGWIGGMFPETQRAKQHANYIDYPITLVLFELNDPSQNVEMKSKCRELFNVQKSSLHTSDFPFDTFRVSASLLNKNSVHFLNNSIDNLSDSTKKLLVKYFEKINNDREDYCLTSSIVLEMYGIRKVNDIDYLHYDDHDIKEDNIDCHKGKWLSYYPTTKHDIIYNPEHHFYFNGYKVASLNTIYRMKQIRNEEKDRKDIKLINRFLGITDQLLAFGKVVSVIRKNTTITKSTYIPVTKREKLWHALCEKIYVIGDTFDDFNIQAKKQGFLNLVTYVKIYRADSAIKELNAKEQNDIALFISESDFVKKPRLMGCHISHALTGADMIKNNIKNALIFENDCAFDNIISDEMLENMGTWHSNHNIPFLNLGTYKFTNNCHPLAGKVIHETRNFTICNNQNYLAHSYIINNSTAKKIADTLDITNLKPHKFFLSEKLSPYFRTEQCYRFGADGYYMTYIDQCAFYPALTYQQLIGGNKEIRPRNKKKFYCEKCGYGYNKNHHFTTHLSTHKI